MVSKLKIHNKDGTITEVEPCKMWSPIPRIELEHSNTKDCWCEPYLDYVDPETGDEVWVYRRFN